MNTFAEVVHELIGMFAADARLTIETLVLVVVVACLVLTTVISPVLGGTLVLVGSLAILIQSSVGEARRAAASRN